MAASEFELAGAEKHAILDEEHKQKVEVELTVSEASTKAQLEAVSLVLSGGLYCQMKPWLSHRR